MAAEKAKKTIVIGHKTPDTDSICSAICYANLKHLQTGGQYIPGRAGHVNSETKFVLDYFKVTAPREIDTVKTQVKDIEIRETKGVNKNISLKKAWNLMQDNNVVTIPAITEDNVLEGLITVGDITRSYMNVYDSSILSKACTQYSNIIETLEGAMLIGDENAYFREGKVLIAAANPDMMEYYIEKNDVLRLAKWAEEHNVRLIVDESFVDFCDNESSPSLLSNEILHEYPHLIVVKSISKSYGVPGLRLGILASDDEALIAFLKKDVAIWNINSFGEFYMQIAEKYQSDYLEALERFYKARYYYIESLRKISGLRVIDSQANYLMCEILPPHSSSEVTQRLLTQFNILIKDLSNKRGIDGRQYIRIAVKRPKENDLLVNALTEILKD